MRRDFFILFIIIALFACKQQPESVIAEWVPYDESGELAESANHASPRMRFKLIQSQVLDKNEMWKNVASQIKNFSEEDYQRLKPLIFEQSIPTVQSHIESGELTYEKLTQWFLYRIVKYENDRSTMLNAIVAINPNAVKEARVKDRRRSAGKHLIYGMPILVKDNVNVGGMPTTAGTHLLRDNYAPDAEIIERIKENGGIILGKTNLSEWANYLFTGGPNGFSAVGGQTLNAYGRRVFDTGGSSSGSGVSMAANYAMASIGTETSGSILSPSGKSSIVGFKPTVGLLSRSGIVPLSSTLDTPGPMTRSVVDNAILLSAMGGNDLILADLENGSLKGLRFGVNKNLLVDSLYRVSIEKIVSMGGIAIEFEPVTINLNGFVNLLSADMKIDLPKYLEVYAGKEISERSIEEIIKYNSQDSLIMIPYGQAIFEGMALVDLKPEELEELRVRLRSEGRRLFETPMDEHQLDAILSIDNLNASHAAAANFPCITVPMGYSKDGQPTGITFIARSFEEEKLLKMAYAFEQATLVRRHLGKGCGL
ncbi:MAG: amidase family protein [Bacteroidales bacterium]|nr:amidase family protein [Bacteroidales bacterium]